VTDLFPPHATCWHEVYKSTSECEWAPRTKPLRANVASMQTQKRAANIMRRKRAQEGASEDTFFAGKFIQGDVAYSDDDEFGDSDEDDIEQAEAANGFLTSTERRANEHVQEAFDQCRKLGIIIGGNFRSVGLSTVQRSASVVRSSGAKE